MSEVKEITDLTANMTLEYANTILHLNDSGGIMVVEINEELLKRQPNHKAVFTWIKHTAQAKTCDKCHGDHNVLICPFIQCIKCYGSGHCAIICTRFDAMDEDIYEGDIDEDNDSIA